MYAYTCEVSVMHHTYVYRCLHRTQKPEEGLG